MDSKLIKIAAVGRPSLAELLGAPSLQPFADKLKGKSPERATLYAAGVEALGEGSAAPVADPNYAAFHTELSERANQRRFNPDVEFMPYEVAEAALKVLKAARANHTFTETVDSDFIPSAVERASFSLVSILRQLARAKVAFPREFSREYVEIVADSYSARINPQLFAAVGGRPAQITAGLEFRMAYASRLARCFYSNVEKPLCVPEGAVEAKLPKRRGSTNATHVPYLELLRALNPEKARDLICDLKNYSSSSIVPQALAALNLGLTQEDALKLEEILPEFNSFRQKDAQRSALRRLKALVARSGADSNLRRQALASAKEFAALSSSDPRATVPDDLEYLPLEDWQEVFQKTPREILNLNREEPGRSELRRKARISYLILDAPDSWALELVQPPSIGSSPFASSPFAMQMLDEYFQFLSTILKNKAPSDAVAREVVDACLRLFAKVEEPSTRYMLIVALFEPYPWRKELRDVVNGYKRKSVLFEKWESKDLRENSDGYSSFAQILFPLLTEEIRDEIHDYYDLGYRSTIANPKIIRELMAARQTVFSKENFESTRILRDYLQKRALVGA